MFPNPSQGKIQIAFPKGVSSVRIRISDIDGKNLRKQVISSDTRAYIDLEGLAKGMYFISLLDRDKVRTFKHLKL